MSPQGRRGGAIFRRRIRESVYRPFLIAKDLFHNCQNKSSIDDRIPCISQVLPFRLRPSAKRWISSFLSFGNRFPQREGFAIPWDLNQTGLSALLCVL
jgi:hypothetical protein